jgi:heptosyltransferase-2
VLPNVRQIAPTALIHFALGSAALVFAGFRALVCRRGRKVPKRILFIGRHHLGDVLMTLPAMRLAREILPNATMDIVLQEKYRGQIDLAEIGFGTVSEIEGLKFLDEVRAWRARFRDGAYDAVVFHRITRPDFAPVLAAFLENIPHRMGGAEKGLQGFLTDVYCPTGRELVVEYHWNLIRAWLSLPPAPVELRWPPLISIPSSATKRWGILIAPFAQHTKEWPAEKWRELLVYARGNGLKVALSAPSPMADRAEALLEGFPEVENLARASTSLIDLFRDVAATCCIVALDTGIRHVAAALEIPCIVLGHGREHYKLFGAYVPTERYLFHPVPCAPCGAEPCPLGHLRCIREIPEKEVIATIRQLVPDLFDQHAISPARPASDTK